MDSDGYYYIVGRKKRYVKIVGNSISLDEIEILIKNNIKNVDTAVIGNDKIKKTISKTILIIK